jgi:hypothetical protein
MGGEVCLLDIKPARWLQECRLKQNNPDIETYTTDVASAFSDSFARHSSP